MSKLLRQNVGGTDFTMAGCTLTGVCASAASDYIKSVTLSDGDILSDGMTIVVEFTNGNTAGTAPSSLTIYSSGQVNYFTDSGLTQPFTLAPAGCYEIEYTGTGNAYTYISYPVMQVGSVSGPLCDSCGRKASGALWLAEDKVSINYSNGCFNVLPQVTDALTFMASSSTVNGAPVHAGSTIRVMFTQDLTGAANTGLILKYNGIDVPVMIGENGNLEAFTPFDAGGTYKYVNAYTTLEMVYDGTQFIVTGNSEAASSAQQTIITTSSDNTPYSQRVNADKDKSVINKLIGASFAVNQKVPNGNFASASGWSSEATLNVSNGVARVTLSGSVWNNDIRRTMSSVTKGHKFLLMVGHRCSSALDSKNFIFGEFYSNETYCTFSGSTSWTIVEKVFPVNVSSERNAKRIALGTAGNNYSGEWFEIRNFNLIDLTQMFGSAIADRIYDMEQATEGSGITWIKSFGFFNNAYYSTDEGSIQSVKPSAHKVSASVASSWKSRNAYAQHIVCLFADALLKPNTTYTLYFRGANGAGIYPNENLFGSQTSIDLDGTLQSRAYTTLGSLPSNQRISEGGFDGWIIFKNRSGNTVVPNFTEFYIVEEGVNVDPTFSQSIPLANTELRGIPKLDANNNLYFDGDIYYPNGDVIRRYGVVDLGSLTWGQQDVGNTQTVSTFFCNDIQTLVKAPSANADKANIVCSKYSTVSYADYFTESPLEGVSILMSGQLRVSDPNNTYNKSSSAFKTAMNGVYLNYELATPTSETVAGYTNPHTLVKKGMEEFVDNRTVPVPVGHETEYAQLPKWMQDGVIFL